MPDVTTSYKKFPLGCFFKEIEKSLYLFFFDKNLEEKQTKSEYYNRGVLILLYKTAYIRSTPLSKD